MANFETLFASDAEFRLASADEKLNGFPCGPAARKLFNGLFRQLQAELAAVHAAGGIAGDDSASNTTLLAIQALIDAATGGGATEGYLLMAQARSRNPVFPIIQTADYKINCSSPGAGTVRIPGGVSFLHRGIFIEETVETDFVTLANKTYHLRWVYGTGYVLQDLANIAYNPTALAEANAAFDSTYDDMLIARVTTSAGNVATITNLANHNELTASYVKATTEAQAGSWSGLPVLTGSPNWARTPRMVAPTNYNVETTVNEEAVVQIGTSRSRYTVTAHCWGYVLGQINTYPAYTSGSISIDVTA